MSTVGVCHLTASVDSSAGAPEISEVVVRVVTTLDVGSSQETVAHVRGVNEVLARVEAWLQQMTRERTVGPQRGETRP
jgi:hypothetical protein